MNRRSFHKKISQGLALASFSPWLLPTMTKRKNIRPTPLQPGDTVGLIAPGSSTTPEKLQKAIENLEKLDLKVQYTHNLLAQNGYLAGTDQQRLDDLHQMFADPNIQAVWCIRGGYGCTRLLEHIDYNLIRKNPKVFIGYSDITALLQAIYQKTGLIGFHGPVASSTFSPYTLAHLRKALIEETSPLVLKNAVENEQSTEANYPSRIIRAGKAKGKLTGGNLSLITAMIGTPFEWKVKNRLLFLEDIGEKPYRIDRMLTQLRQAYDLSAAAGIVLGIFADCEAKAGAQSLSLAETFDNRLGDLGIPVMYGMSFGHIEHQFTLPVGLDAVMDTEERSLVFNF